MGNGSLYDLGVYGGDCQLYRNEAQSGGSCFHALSS